jgi:coniferyl-aldehyde dehydrogenase
MVKAMKASEFQADMQSAFELQRAAFARQPHSQWPERRDRLQRLRRLVTENEEEIERAIDADFGGRPAIETQIAEVYPSLAEINGALRSGKAWMTPQKVWVAKWFLPARAEIQPRPLGVVGIIVPWNYPLYLAVTPMAGALAAGNRVLVKMSEVTPNFSAFFKRLVDKYFAPEEASVITGDAAVAQAFSELPFDHLLFTGSTVVGKRVMAAAAANLTPVTLELGGKSPTVIAPGYPVQRAATRILAGKLLNAGQTCIAPDYVLLPKDLVKPFVREARAQARKMYPAGLANRDFCSIINERHYARLTGYLEQAKQAGVRIEPLFEGRTRDNAGRRLAPALLVDPPAALDVMREEIFGPLLPLLPYEQVEEAVAHINARPKPLALYWFDEDETRTEWALHNTQAGGVCVNETLLHVAQEELPFGGVGPSGMGHYHGRHGFETFSKMTPVFVQSRLNGMGLFMPPYGPLVRRLLALMKRF